MIAATLRVATPLIYGTIGEIYTERAGVLNLGIEGTMFLGAFVGFAVAAKAEAAGMGGYLWLGLAAAVLAGVLMALLMGLLTVTLGLNQHVSGLGITLLATALSLFGFRLVFGESAVLPSVDPFPQVAPFGETPILGPIFTQYLLTYIAFLVDRAAGLVGPVPHQLRPGHPLRGREPGGGRRGRPQRLPHTLCCADDRRRADGGGRRVPVVGAAWRVLARHHRRPRLGVHRPGDLRPLGPLRGLLGALLFGGVFALQLRLQTLGFDLPFEVLLALPYLVTIAALAIAGRNAAYPGAYLKPYRRE